MKCSICKEKIQPMYHKGKYVYDGSCNALPVNKGRCCSICDETVVIPLRVQSAMIRAMKKEEGKDEYSKV